MTSIMLMLTATVRAEEFLARTEAVEETDSPRLAKNSTYLDYTESRPNARWNFHKNF